MHAVEWIVLVAWGFALVTTLVNLRLIPRLGAFAAPAAGARVSVVMPARNEERGIGRAVRAMLAQSWTDLEVIVVDDRSTDATGAILAEIDDPRLVVVDGEEPPPGWLGKPWAIEQGTRRATGDLLLLADADPVYEPEAVAAAVAYLERTGISLVSLFPRLEMHGFWEHAGLTQLPLTGFVFFQAWLGNRSRIVSLGLGGGPGTLVRRAAFEAAGGYAAVHDAVVDDIGFVRQVRAHGYRTHLVIADRFVTLRMYHGLRETVNGFTKNTFSALGRSYGAAAVLIGLLAVGHIAPFVRLFSGDPLAIATVAVITLTRVILFARLRYPVFYAVVLHPVTVFLWLWILLRSVWVTGVRRQLHWRGRSAAAWSRFGRSGR